MLREDVVDAAAQGLFHVYAVGHVDEAEELLTSRAAGEPDAAGRLPEGTVNQLVTARLAQMALDRQAYATGQPRRPLVHWRKPGPRGRPADPR